MGFHVCAKKKTGVKYRKNVCVVDKKKFVENVVRRHKRPRKKKKGRKSRKQRERKFRNGQAIHPHPPEICSPGRDFLTQGGGTLSVTPPASSGEAARGKKKIPRRRLKRKAGKIPGRKKQSHANAWVAPNQFGEKEKPVLDEKNST